MSKRNEFKDELKIPNFANKNADDGLQVPNFGYNKANNVKEELDVASFNSGKEKRYDISKKGTKNTYKNKMMKKVRNIGLATLLAAGIGVGAKACGTNEHTQPNNMGGIKVTEEEARQRGIDAGEETSWKERKKQMAESLFMDNDEAKELMINELKDKIEQGIDEQVYNIEIYGTGNGDSESKYSMVLVNGGYKKEGGKTLYPDETLTKYINTIVTSNDRKSLKELLDIDLENTFIESENGVLVAYEIVAEQENDIEMEEER